MQTWAGAAGSLPRTRYMTESEIRRLLAAVKCVTKPWTRRRYQVLFLLLANFGPRISEALSVRAGDVETRRDDEGRLGGTITFPTLKRWRTLPTGEKARVWMTRSLPLSSELAGELARYIAVERLRPSDYLFGTRSMNRWRKYTWTVFKRALVAAGLSRHYRLHDLRHSAGTYLADKTRDPALVRDVLGHASIATSNVYIHTINLREKLLAVPTILPGTDGQPEGGEEG